MDKKDLKNQALLETVSEITTNYENRVADLRVEVTVLTAEKQALEEEVKRLNELVPKDNDPAPEDGNVEF